MSTASPPRAAPQGNSADGCRDASEQRQPGLVEFFGRLNIGERAGQRVQVIERDALAHERRRVRQAGQLVQRRHRVFCPIPALDAPGLLRVGQVGGEQARAVEVQERIEVFDAEDVEAHRVALRDVLVAEELAHDRAVLGF